MRLLVVGGTRFVGRHIVQAALERGHDVVIFNRGRTNPGLFPEAIEVRGDRRSGGLAQLTGEEYDAVIDTTAYHPDDVAASLAIGGGVKLYCLVSSLSVLRDPVSSGADETAPVWMPSGALPAEPSTPEAYGLLKAQCENRAREVYGERALIVRPGIVVGPHDPTERLTSWLRRMTARRVVLAGEADQPVQLIDARDLASWIIDAGESRARGVFNVTGPAEPLSFADLLSLAARTTSSPARIVWAGDHFLLEREVALPLWVPRVDHAFFQVSNARALAAGLILRPLAETLADVASLDAASAQREQAVLPDAVEDALLAEI